MAARCYWLSWPPKARRISEFCAWTAADRCSLATPNSRERDICLVAAARSASAFSRSTVVKRGGGPSDARATFGEARAFSTAVDSQSGSSTCRASSRRRSARVNRASLRGQLLHNQRRVFEHLRTRERFLVRFEAKRLSRVRSPCSAEGSSDPRMHVLSIEPATLRKVLLDELLPLGVIASASSACIGFGGFQSGPSARSGQCEHGAQAFRPSRSSVRQALGRLRREQGRALSALPSNQSSASRLVLGIFEGRWVPARAGDARDDLRHRQEIVFRSKSRSQRLRFDAAPTRQRPNLAGLVHRYEAASISACQSKPFRQQRRFEGRAGIRRFPQTSEHALERGCIALRAFGLTGLLPAVVRPISLGPILEPFRHGPIVGAVEFSRHLRELPLVVGQVDRPHAPRVDPRPDAVRVAATVLLMENNGAGLTREPQALFNDLDRVLERFDGDGFARRRVQGQREQVLRALRGFADRRGLVERTRQVLRHEPVDRVQLDMVVVEEVRQVPRQLRPMPPLIAFGDHEGFANAASSGDRISAKCAFASAICARSKSPTKSRPMFA